MCVLVLPLHPLQQHRRHERDDVVWKIAFTMRTAAKRACLGGGKQERGGEKCAEERDLSDIETGVVGKKKR